MWSLKDNWNNCWMECRQSCTMFWHYATLCACCRARFTKSEDDNLQSNESFQEYLTNAMSSLPTPTCNISLIIAQCPSNGSIKTQQVPRSHWVPLGSDQFVNSQGTISSNTTHWDIIVSLQVAQTWNPEKKCILHCYAVCTLQWTVFIMYFALLCSWQSVCGANDLITTWSQTFHLVRRHLVN